MPSGYARVRTFGWLHPAAKVRANRVRAFLGEKPMLTPAEEQTWNSPQEIEPECQLEKADAPHSAPLCPLCQKAMRLIGSWTAGKFLLPPKRPP